VWILVAVSLHPVLIGRGDWRTGPLALHCSVKGYFWSRLHVGRSIPKCALISRRVSACWQVNPQMYIDFPMSVLSSAISVFLSTKSSSASVVLVRFFPRFFLGLAFCGFLPKVRFSIKPRPDRVLQRRVRRFSSEMRKKTSLKMQKFPAVRPYWSRIEASARYHIAASV